MPFFAGLTREGEEDAEEHLKLQLRSLIEHKNEHAYFSQLLQQLIVPNFKPKKKRVEDDPAWRPGTKKTGKPRKAQPPPAPAPTSPTSCPASPRLHAQDQPPVEENLSTNLADFADFFS